MPLTITCAEVPNQMPYWKGASWWTALTHVIPFFQGYAIKQGWVTWNPSEWVTYTYFGYDRAGRGFTITAEGYLNFGFIGAFGEVMFFGMFIRWLTVRFARNPNAMWAFIMFGCFGASVMVIRNHLNLVTNAVAQAMMLAFLLNYLLGNEPAPEPEGYQMETHFGATDEAYALAGSE